MGAARYFAERAFLPHGWAHRVLIEVDAAGNISRLQEGAEPEQAEVLDGPVLPGFPNLHSHAFQRAMAGLAERAGKIEDSFWTWREVMYRFLARLGPEEVEAIAAQLYVEMLKAGYTAVGEFHYLHHDPRGEPYDNVAELAVRVVSAARRSGIGMTLLPVLYGYGGFGGQAAGEGQRRFLNPPERLLEIVRRAIDLTHHDANFRVGLAPHSLRAVTESTLREVLGGLSELDREAPIHIHVAEQTKEVEDCVAWSGRRPVEWLFDCQPVSPQWCLVHATHVSDAEMLALANSGAVAGLCPTTEANLGDGLFPAVAYLKAGGLFGIGSDSHISISPIEELRWLEYGQRLLHRARNLICGDAGRGSVGASLIAGALAGGAQALGRPIGRLVEGARSDLLVLDGQSPNLLGRSEKVLLDALVFAGNANPVKHVMVGGRWCVRDRRHAAGDEILEGYRLALARLVD